MLYCPNFFWNVLQVWMTGKDVYLQMTWSWPDKTWNILCSYCLQWNTSQSKFRNHYFLFLFAFSILSQLFLIWGCIYAVWGSRCFAYASAYISDHLFLLLPCRVLIQTFSTLSEDNVIAPPVYLWKRKKTENSINGRERVKYFFLKEVCLFKKKNVFLLFLLIFSCECSYLK